ncbi:hypothetical protein HDU76_004318 [Blyttiomyces sp. JEL0837]|nr:hypothetical protein HDU76_004318 [Blyttiomyces sp. JEL0837]
MSVDRSHLSPHPVKTSSFHKTRLIHHVQVSITSKVAISGLREERKFTPSSDDIDWFLPLAILCMVVSCPRSKAGKKQNWFRSWWAAPRSSRRKLVKSSKIVKILQQFVAALLPTKVRPGNGTCPVKNESEQAKTKSQLADSKATKSTPLSRGCSKKDPTSNKNPSTPTPADGSQQKGHRKAHRERKAETATQSMPDVESDSETGSRPSTCCDHESESNRKSVNMDIPSEKTPFCKSESQDSGTQTEDWTAPKARPTASAKSSKDDENSKLKEQVRYLSAKLKESQTENKRLVTILEVGVHVLSGIEGAKVLNGQAYAGNAAVAFCGNFFRKFCPRVLGCIGKSSTCPQFTKESAGDTKPTQDEVIEEIPRPDIIEEEEPHVPSRYKFFDYYAYLPGYHIVAERLYQINSDTIVVYNHLCNGLDDALQFVKLIFKGAELDMGQPSTWPRDKELRPMTNPFGQLYFVREIQRIYQDGNSLLLYFRYMTLLGYVHDVLIDETPLPWGQSNTSVQASPSPAYVPVAPTDVEQQQQQQQVQDSQQGQQREQTQRRFRKY